MTASIVLGILGLAIAALAWYYHSQVAGLQAQVQSSTAVLQANALVLQQLNASLATNAAKANTANQTDQTNAQTINDATSAATFLAGSGSNSPSVQPSANPASGPITTSPAAAKVHLAIRSRGTCFVCGFGRGASDITG